MRIRFLLVCVSAGFIGAGFAIQACGSTTNDSVSADSGAPDVLDSSVKDTSVADVQDSAPACDPNKDVLQGIPDGSIADGGSSVGVCLGCASTKCKAQIDACKKDCACQDLAGSTLECLAKAQSIAQSIACAAAFQNVSKATQQIGLLLASCVQSDCSAECQAAAFSGDGGDAGDADAH